MDNKAELIGQLEKACQLLSARDEETSKLEFIKSEIDSLDKAIEKGVEYQNWYPTNNADTTKAEINKVRHTKTVRRRTPCIVAMPVCGIYGIALFAAGLTGGGILVAAVGFLLFMVAIAALVLLIIVQKTRNNWSAEQLEQLKQAESLDGHNLLLNMKKKEQLDAEFRMQKYPELAELHDHRKESEKVLSNIYRELKNVSVISEKDQNVKTASGLLEILRSNRANTLQEAFRIYDEQQHREQMLEAQEEANRQARVAQNRILEQMAENEAHRQEEAEQLRQDMLRREYAEAEHRKEMERLQWKQIEELERKRKVDNEYRRSGHIEHD